jgi:hypothetical protein
MRVATVLQSASLMTLCTLSGCGVPEFDVYHNEAGDPSAYWINKRIRCELADLTRKNADGQYEYKYGRYIHGKHYDVEMTIYLEVNNTGGLIPTLKSTLPLSKTTSFAFGGSGELQESRDHTFTQTIAFPLSDIEAETNTTLSVDRCNFDGSNLSGVLGIKNIVDVAVSIPVTSPELQVPGSGSSGQPSDSQGGASGGAEGSNLPQYKQLFGGTIQFVVTKNISAVGPMWTLEHFSGPGGLLGLSSVSTNKLTIGFGTPSQSAPGEKPTKTKGPPANPELHDFMNTISQNQYSSQLSQVLQNTSH